MLASAGSTVVITTHYLEEVKAADRIGFAREGRILAQDDPRNFLAKFETDSLEAVFHKLCSSGFDEVDVDGHGEVESEPLITEKRVVLDGENGGVENRETSVLGQRRRNIGDKFKALVFKNLKVLQRHKVLMSFQASPNSPSFLPLCNDET